MSKKKSLQNAKLTKLPSGAELEANAQKKSCEKMGSVRVAQLNVATAAIGSNTKMKRRPFGVGRPKHWFFFLGLPSAIEIAFAIAKRRQRVI